MIMGWLHDLFLNVWPWEIVFSDLNHQHSRFSLVLLLYIACVMTQRMKGRRQQILMEGVKNKRRSWGVSETHI